MNDIRPGQGPAACTPFAIVLSSYHTGAFGRLWPDIRFAESERRQESRYFFEIILWIHLIWFKNEENPNEPPLVESNLSPISRLNSIQLFRIDEKVYAGIRHVSSATTGELGIFVPAIKQFIVPTRTKTRTNPFNFITNKHRKNRWHGGCVYLCLRIPMVARTNRAGGRLEGTKINNHYFINRFIIIIVRKTLIS